MTDVDKPRYVYNWKFKLWVPRGQTLWWRDDNGLHAWVMPARAT